MQNQELATLIQQELFEVFTVRSLIKGSTGYGAADEHSDIDIQLNLQSPKTFEDIKRHFGGASEVLEFTNSRGMMFKAYSVEFDKDGKEISFFYEDYPGSYEEVQMIIKEISELPSPDRYILRLVSGGYKYDKPEAYKLILQIFHKLEKVLSPELVTDICAGKRISKDQASILSRAVQVIYINDVGGSYKRLFL